MRPRIVQLYGQIAAKYPRTAYVIKRLYLRRPFNVVSTRIKGIGNRLDYRWAILSSVSFDIEGNMNTIDIGPSCVLNSVKFMIRGSNNHVSIAQGCQVHDGAVVGVEDSGGSIFIGENTSFQEVALSLTEGGNIRIGRDCLFAYEVDIRNGDSHAIVDARTGIRTNPACDVSIGDRVWVAIRSTILKGSTIRDDSVVAAGSVVTRQFSEPGVVIAGNPATVVRRHIAWRADRTVTAETDQG